MERNHNRVLLSMLACCLAILALAGCKKDNEEETLPYLSGSVRFSLPTHVRPGYREVIEASGASAADGSTVGYYWYSSWGDGTYDTTSTFKVKIPSDTIGTLTLSCYAYAEGYNRIGSSVSIIVVNDELNGSLKKTDISADNERFLDERDNMYYYTAEVAGLKWMRNNLAYDGVGVPFMEAEPMRKPYGHYYTWNEAQTACPEGWRLPTDAEWAALASEVSGNSFSEGDQFNGVAGSLMVNAEFNKEKMWEYWPAVSITNKSKMSIIPCGYAVLSKHNIFAGENEYATFWTATEKSDDPQMAVYRYIHVKKPDVFVGKGDKTSFRASVRCVQDLNSPKTDELTSDL